MRIVLEAEERIRLTGEGEGLSFEATEAALSPFHLLGASLATCTHSALEGWAAQARMPMEGLEIVVEWEMGGDPYRVIGVRMELIWPGLAAGRVEAAKRVAAHCTVHHTMEAGTKVETVVRAAVS